MIPDYQSLMLPLLQSISDQKEYKSNQIEDILGQKLDISESERKQLLSSGRQPLFTNRISWAKIYLKKAGLIGQPTKGTFKITEEGLKTLRSNPERIDNNYLKQFESFNDFINQSKSGKSTLDTNVRMIEKPIEITPEESLEKAYDELRTNLSNEILTKLYDVSPAFFEKLVVELIVAMGYGGTIQDAGKAIGRSGDEGIDGTIKEDKLGLDIIYIQAKRWKKGNVIGRPEIQKFVGALAGQGAKKGIFITTSSFTKEASDYTPKNETKIVLIDGIQLTQLMIDYNIGCSLHQVYEVKKMDGDYFED